VPTFVCLEGTQCETPYILHLRVQPHGSCMCALEWRHWSHSDDLRVIVMVNNKLVVRRSHYILAGTAGCDAGAVEPIT